MMDRAEASGFGIAVVGHVALLAALTFSLTRAGETPPPPPAMEVSLVDEVGLVNAAPVPSTAPPPPSEAPDIGAPEEAAPQPEPTPAPPEPQPEPAPPPRPQPRAEPRPQPKQEPRPQPRAEPRREAEPTRRQTPARPAPTPPRQADRSGAGSGERSRGSRLGPDLLKGIGSDPAPTRSNNPPAQMTGQAVASIASAIQRQIQPCADRQVYPGPGAERIVTPVILRLNRDGSLNGRPRVGTQTGIDDENRRYADRVADLAVRSFVECAPLRGLPEELYDVPNGWRNFTMRYRLPG